MNQYHLWRNFEKLGEMIGDGMHHEEPWISKEYNRLQKILIPEVKEIHKKRRQEKGKRINKMMEPLLATKKCHCGGCLKQARSGSKVAKCVDCNARFVAKTIRKK